MAAGVLSRPGTEYGPCKPRKGKGGALEHCAHLDCQRTRFDATMPCRICTKPIGYDVRFYKETDAPNGTSAPPSGYTLVHAVCAEVEIERAAVNEVRA